MCADLAITYARKRTAARLFYRLTRGSFCTEILRWNNRHWRLTTPSERE